MIGSSRSYAIGMAHFQIAGGLRTLVILCAGYLAIVGAVIGWLSYDAAVNKTGPVITHGAVMLILLLETLVLLFFGSFRIAGAIRTDLTSKMMESHRLMPIPSWRAVAGYLFGSTSHIIGFALLNVLLAYVFAGISGSSMQRVTMSEAVLALFVLLAWSASALGAFRGRVYGVIVGITISGSFMGGIYLYGLMPGLALLITPLMGQTIYYVAPSSLMMQWAYPAAFAAQGVFFAIFFAGACRAYRGTYAATFSMAQSLLLLLAWSATSLVGIALWDKFRFVHVLSENTFSPQTQTIASLIAAMLIALVPLRTLTVLERSWKHRGIKTGAVLLAITAIISLIPLAITKTPEATAAHFAITFLIVASHVACVYLLFCVMRRAKALQMFIAITIPGLALWVGPLVIELIRMWMNSTAGQAPGPDTGIISSFSPPALLGFVWTPGSHVSPAAGLVWLCALPLALAGLIVPKLRKRAGRAAAMEKKDAGAAPPIRFSPAPSASPSLPATSAAVTAAPPESASS